MDILPELESLANSDTPYAPYSAMAIARAYLSSAYATRPESSHEEAEQQRQRGLATAAQWADRANREGATYQAQALALKSDILRRQGQLADAMVIEKEILAKHPESAAAARLR